MNNGDMWEIPHRIVSQKGAQEIRVTWTKGHVTDEQVRTGTHTAEAKVGNVLADKFADIGAEGYSQMLGKWRENGLRARPHTLTCWRLSAGTSLKLCKPMAKEGN